jgi:hypothetical protein
MFITRNIAPFLPQPVVGDKPCLNKRRGPKRFHAGGRPSYIANGVTRGDVLSRRRKFIAVDSGNIWYHRIYGAGIEIGCRPATLIAPDFVGGVL